MQGYSQRVRDIVTDRIWAAESRLKTDRRGWTIQ